MSPMTPKISPNHHCSTTVLDSWHEVLVLICCVWFSATTLRIAQSDLGTNLQGGPLLGRLWKYKPECSRPANLQVWLLFTLLIPTEAEKVYYIFHRTVHRVL